MSAFTVIRATALSIRVLFTFLLHTAASMQLPNATQQPSSQANRISISVGYSRLPPALHHIPHPALPPDTHTTSPMTSQGLFQTIQAYLT